MNQRAILLLLISNSISGISQGISMIAIPWYFTASLGFQSEFGIFYGLLTIVSIFWSLYAGSLIDRYNRRNILIYQSIIGLIILSISSYLIYLNLYPLWLIAGIVFIFTVLIYNIHYMNIYSFAQEMTPLNQYNKIVSYIEIQGQATTILGGAFAAILLDGSTDGFITLFGFKFKLGFELAKWDLSRIFALDALTYLIAILILSQIKFKAISERKIELESTWIRVKTGWNFLKDKTALLIFGWLSSSVFVAVMLVSYFLMPSYVSLFLKQSSNVFASSELYFALGAMIAGYSARYFLQSMHEVWRIIILTFLGAFVFILFSFNTLLWVFYISNILFGYANAAIRFNRITYFWKIVPNHLMGRVSSVINIASYVLRSFWGFIFACPIFMGQKGIQLVMITIFGFICISGLVIFLYRDKIKKLEY